MNHCTVYTSPQTDLQYDATFIRLARAVEGTESDVKVVRREMPFTIISISWQDTLSV